MEPYSGLTDLISCIGNDQSTNESPYLIHRNYLNSPLSGNCPYRYPFVMLLVIRLWINDNEPADEFYTKDFMFL